MNRSVTDLHSEIVELVIQQCLGAETEHENNVLKVSANNCVYVSAANMLMGRGSASFVVSIPLMTPPLFKMYYSPVSTVDDAKMDTMRREIGFQSPVRRGVDCLSDKVHHTH